MITTVSGYNLSATYDPRSWKTLSCNIKNSTFIITRIRPFGWAENCGLIPGDRLISVNGRAMSDIKDVQHELISCRARGEAIEFTFQRKFWVSEPAQRWLQAARNGSAQGFTNLALCYCEGLGVPRSRRIAMIRKYRMQSNQSYFLHCIHFAHL